jgi:hypothetical protein
MKTLRLATLHASVMVIASAFGLLISPGSVHAGGATAESGFPYIIQLESGASEFTSGDEIVISSVRGNREHLELGGRYLLDGSYTLASSESADLAWFSTSRGPSGSTPISEQQHVLISKGSGSFHLEKTLLDDGWLHVSFYVNGHSHGGIYFGEKGSDKTVLRTKDWSDFSTPSPEKPGHKSRAIENGASLRSEAGNTAIMAFLGNPIPAPANLDAKYSPTNLIAAFTAMSGKAGWPIQRLAVDDSEFPFLLYGVLAGRHELGDRDIREVKGYEYGGSVRGNTAAGSTYFSLNITPRDQYPSDLIAPCNRRLMVRLQMLAEAVGKKD